MTASVERLAALIAANQDRLDLLEDMIDPVRRVVAAEFFKVETGTSTPQIITASAEGGLILGSEGKPWLLDPAAARFPDANAPAVAKVPGTNRLMLVLDFSQSVSQKTYWHFGMGEREAAAVKYHLDWTATGGTPGQKIVFDIVAYGVANDEVYTTGGSSDSVSATDTLIAANDLHRITVSAGATDPFDARHHTFIEISRDPGVGDDNLAAKGRFLGGLVEILGA